MTVEIMDRKQRVALKCLDVNSAPSANSDGSVKKASNLTVTEKTHKNNEGTSAPVTSSNTFEVIVSKTTDKEAQAKVFQSVCQKRVSCLLESDSDDMKQWSFQDFDYIRELGSGGAATVFLAREKQSGYQVALKMQDAENEEAMCEIYIHEDLNGHPSIVKMYDHFYSDEPFVNPEEDFSDDDSSDDESSSPKRYLIMILELCDGGSLFDVIRDAETGCLSENQAASYLRDAIDALDYTHKQDIIHCDIKSLNFLVQGGTCKLADFGMAVENDARLIIGGSPSFMAPEHLMAWRHMTSDFDHRSDIYSLGILLFEILVGYLPYEVIEKSSDGDDSVNTSFDDDAFRPPLLDLGKLDDHSSNEPFYIPPPIFPDFVSQEAQDLISRLIEPSLENRMTLAEAKNHAWFQKY